MLLKDLVHNRYNQQESSFCYLWVCLAPFRLLLVIHFICYHKRNWAKGRNNCLGRRLLYIVWGFLSYQCSQQISCQENFSVKLLEPRTTRAIITWNVYKIIFAIRRMVYYCSSLLKNKILYAKQLFHLNGSSLVVVEPDTLFMIFSDKIIICSIYL